VLYHRCDARVHIGDYSVPEHQGMAEWTRICWHREGRDVMAGPDAVVHRFVVYPRPPTAPLAVAGDTTKEMVFAEQLAGPDGGRAAVCADDVYADRRTRGQPGPTFVMIAGSGDPVTVTPTATEIHRGPGGVGFGDDVWLDEPPGVTGIYVGRGGHDRAVAAAHRQR